jgi:hypothetical protein
MAMYPFERLRNQQTYSGHCNKPTVAIVPYQYSYQWGAPRRSCGPSLVAGPEALDVSGPTIIKRTTDPARTGGPNLGAGADVPPAHGLPRTNGTAFVSLVREWRQLSRLSLRARVGMSATLVEGLA